VPCFIHEGLKRPFTLGKGIRPSEFAATLRLPIYRSVADESVISRWVATPGPKSAEELAALLDCGPQLERSSGSLVQKPTSPDFVRDRRKSRWSRTPASRVGQRILSDANNAKTCLVSEKPGTER